MLVNLIFVFDFLRKDTLYHLSTRFEGTKIRNLLDALHEIIEPKF